MTYVYINVNIQSRGEIKGRDDTKIKYGNLYCEKNIKKHYLEREMLEKIKNHIKQSKNFFELMTNPISKMYGYEALKYELNEYYSFNLCKNGGKIRLIFSVEAHINQVCLEFISLNHYEDFKQRTCKK